MLRRALFRFANFTEIAFPALSPSMQTGKIIKWNLVVGDRVDAGTKLVDVETDKAVVPFTNEVEEGYLAKIFVQAGETAAIADIIAILVDSKEEIAEADQYRRPAPAAAASAEPSSKEAPAATAPAAAPAATPAAAPSTKAPVPTSPTTLPTTNTSEAIGDRLQRSGPAVALLSSVLTIDEKDQLRAVAGTGKNGRFSKQDIVAKFPDVESRGARADASPSSTVTTNEKKASSSTAPATNGSTNSSSSSTPFVILGSPVVNFSVSDTRTLQRLIKKKI